MSKASANRTIEFVTKSGTYTAMIMSPKGDLYQEYESQTATSKVQPSFKALGSPFYKPKLYFVLTNSRVIGEVSPDDVEFYIGNGQIVFDTSGLSTGLLVGSTLNTDYAGAFQKLVPGTNGETQYGLQILENLPAIVGWTSITIKMVGVITPANSTVADRISVTYTIPISQITGDSARVTITSPGDNFTIKAKEGTCKLEAKLIMGGEIADDTGWSFMWYKMGLTGTNNTPGWIPLITSTPKELVVVADDVDTSGMFRVVATKNTTEISDVATVMDVSDPWDIVANPSPEDETIEEGSNGTVVYHPKLVRRGTDIPISNTQQAFFFVLTDFAGNTLNPEDENISATEFTVTEAHCHQGSDTDLSLTIIAV